MKHISIVLRCIIAASFFRILFPGLSWGYWRTYLERPWRQQVGILLISPIIEAVCFGLVYIAVSLAVFSIHKKFFKYNLTYTASILISTLCAVFGYFVVAVATNSLWRKKEILPLIIVYGLTGALYGFLHYRAYANTSVDEAS
ncbi:hypothetical protein [Hymenobacter lucidus]|uniref:Uncharacterized protein n=1 Tax=Hymenobacter lucidus TaxID=2880930 RepID=A0ABS8AUW6_9BACT|nr:hypothetical protein [Hymenobacter lucidus]MCB2409783.1 hypothetical protein [Hymenobacter lucidus]